MDLVERLKKIIQELGLKNDEFAEKCGISKPQIYKYLNGTQEPGTKFYRNLSMSFPLIDIGWLITGTGGMIRIENGCYPKGERAGMGETNDPYILLLNQFEDKEAVYEIGQNLLFIEQRSKAAFEKARNIIMGLKEGTSVAVAGDRRKKSSTMLEGTDRRKKTAV
jgi:transcriptional regulator with XRE-family HTH domain